MLNFAAPFYNNRAACRLKVGDLHGCVSDATAALDLLKGGVGSNADDRAKALARRGAALASLGLEAEAAGEFRAAAALRPGDAGLREAADRLGRAAADGSSIDEGDEGV